MKKTLSGNNHKCDDDLRPNDYTYHCIKMIIPILSCVILLYFLFSFLGKKYFSGISIPAPDVAFCGLFGSLVILIIAYIIGRLINHSDSRLKYIMIVLCIAAMSLIQIYLGYIVILTSFAALLIAAQYSNKNVIRVAYILTMVSSAIAVFANYKYGVCDANMVLSLTERASYYGGTVSGKVSDLSDNIWSLFLLGILPRWILITAFVPLINSIVDNRREIIVREVETQYKGEHDALTGFYNRNKYEAMLIQKYLQSEKISLIFLDINNLKYTNDNLGHEKGDQLIEMAALAINRSLNKEMDAYRFGGDEFLVVLNNGDDLEVEKFLTYLNDNLREINAGQSEIKCSLAMGCSTGEGKDFKEILHMADMKMYENKLMTKMEQHTNNNKS